MFTVSKLIKWIYSKEGYYFFKSGMYLDYYFKEALIKIWNQVNIYLGIIFLEKFIVERITKQLTNNFLFSYASLLNVKKRVSSNQLTTLLYFAVVIILVFLLVWF